MKEFWQLDWLTSRIAMIVNCILTVITCICISIFIPNIHSLKLILGYKILIYTGLSIAIILLYLLALLIIYFIIWIVIKFIHRKS